MDSQENEAFTQVPVSDAMADTRDGSFKRKWEKRLIAIGIAAMVVLAIVVAFIIAMQPIKREAGAWPDFAYLATLMDEPDMLVHAVDDPRLAEAYQRYKKNPSSAATSIEAPIFIDDLGGNAVGDEGETRFWLVMANYDELAAFGIEYAPEPDTARLGENEWYTDMLAAIFLADQRTGSSRRKVFSESLADSSTAMKEKYQIRDEHVDGIAIYPIRALNAVGLNLNELRDMRSSYGVASWEAGYAVALYDQGIQMIYGSNKGESDESSDPIFSGYMTQLEGEYGIGEITRTIHLEASSFDAVAFSDLDTEQSDTMTIVSRPSFSVSCARDALFSSDLASRFSLNEANKKIWEFFDGDMPSTALE